MKASKTTRKARRRTLVAVGQIHRSVRRIETLLVAVRGAPAPVDCSPPHLDLSCEGRR